MGDLIGCCEEMVSHVQDLLNSEDNQEWISRYSKYAGEINANWDKIKNLKKNRFNEWAPLYLYMNVTEAKGRMIFSLRYLGQDVAKLKVTPGKITISTKGFDVTNEKFFECPECVIKLNNSEWNSDDASNFRKHFSNNPKRIDGMGKRNEEHRIESMFLTEFSKKMSKDKIMSNIQPVKIAGIARFQMPTPLNASDINNVKFSGPAGGGIDILSRIGTGSATKLCIMELKDENNAKETPEKAILQGLAYATFIRELLRSADGSYWWKIFGFSGRLPERLELYVTCVMPYRNCKENNKSFAGKIIKTGEDFFHLNYVYFQEVTQIAKIETALKQCIS